MYDPITTPNINIDIKEFISLRENADIKDLSYLLNRSVNSFVKDMCQKKENSYCKDDIANIIDMTDKIIKKLNSNRVEELLMRRSGIIYKNLNTNTHTKVVEEYEKLNNVLNLILKKFPSKQGRPKNDINSIGYLKETFVSGLMQVYEQATGKKTTRNAHNSNSASTNDKDHISEFNDFANKVLEKINEKYPNLEKKHNISISFDDYLKRRAKNT